VALALLLPITLGGLGVRESSYASLIDHAGATAAQGASTGFALGFMLIVSNAFGLLLVEVVERMQHNARPVDSSSEPAPVES
jgi:hypothetical protein